MHGPPGSLSEVIILELKETLLVFEGGAVCPVRTQGPAACCENSHGLQGSVLLTRSVGMLPVTVKVPVDPRVLSVTRRGARGADSRGTRSQESHRRLRARAAVQTWERGGSYF